MSKVLVTQYEYVVLSDPTAVTPLQPQSTLADYSSDTVVQVANGFSRLNLSGPGTARVAVNTPAGATLTIYVNSVGGSGADQQLMLIPQYYNGSSYADGAPITGSGSSATVVHWPCPVSQLVSFPGAWNSGISYLSPSTGAVPLSGTTGTESLGAYPWSATVIYYY